MTRLVLVRHCETVWNEAGRFQGGSTLLSLTPRGQRHAAALSRAVAFYDPVALYASALPRAMETACAIGGTLKLQPVPMRELRELEMGEMTGITGQEFRAKYPELAARWQADPSAVTLPGGESVADLDRRAWGAVSGMLAKHPEDTIAVVSHHFVLQTIACHVVAAPLSSVRCFRMDLGSVTLAEIGEGYSRLLLLNDRSHIPLDDRGTAH